MTAPATHPPFSVRVRLTVDQLVDLSLDRDAAPYLEAAWHYRAWMFVGSAATAMLALAIAGSLSTSTAAIAAVIALVFTAILVQPFVWTRGKLERWFARGYDALVPHGLVAERVVTVDCSGITSESAHASTSVRWTAVSRIDELGNCLVFTTVCGPILIPRTSVGTEDVYQLLVTAVKNWWWAVSPEGRSVGFPVVRHDS